MSQIVIQTKLSRVRDPVKDLQFLSLFFRPYFKQALGEHIPLQQELIIVFQSVQRFFQRLWKRFDFVLLAFWQAIQSTHRYKVLIAKQ